MNKPTIFISHITKEKDIAIAVKELLEKKFLKTFNVFVSSHQESLQLGDNWMETIKQSVENCQLMIIICSPISITRPWINFEAGAGWVRKIPVIPLCHSGMTPSKLPVPINSFQGGSLNNRQDIKNLFNRIANLLNIAAPSLNEEIFFDAINNFEVQTQNTVIKHDTAFIHNLLFSQIELLTYSIFASTLDYKDQTSIEPDKEIEGYNFNFRDIHHLFKDSLLMMFIGKKVYQVYYNTIQNLMDDIKFILSHQKLEISPNLKYLLNSFLFHSGVITP